LLEATAANGSRSANASARDDDLKSVADPARSWYCTHNQYMANEEDNGASWGSRRAAAVAARQQAQKELRRQAYQKAKEQRAKDPRYLQMKEAAKARRREHYERVKQHRKAAQAAGKAARSVQRASAETEAREFFQKGRAPRAQLRLKASEAAVLLATDVVVANDVG
jgi:hypothetical protein